MPFSGPSGKLLDAVLSQVGLDRQRTFLTNAVLCRPPDNRVPTKTEVAACFPRLQKELQALPLDQVVTLGNTATQVLLNTRDGITTVRVGPPKRSPYLDHVEVIPTFHPAACLRIADNFPSLVQDFGKLDRTNRVVWQEPQYKVFDDDKAVDVIDELLMRPDLYRLVIDIEVGIEKDTDFDHPERYGFLCIAIGYARGKVIVIGEEALKLPSVIESLQLLLEARKLVAHNGKFDLSGLTGLDIRNLKLWFDTMLGHYVLDERKGIHSLGYLGVEILGTPDWKHVLDEFVGAGKKKASYALVPRPILYKYCAFDVSVTWDLMEWEIVELAKTPGFRELHDHLCRASDLYSHIEQKGIRFDVEYLQELDKIMTAELITMREGLGRWIANPNSWQQIQAALLRLGIRTASTADLPLQIILRKVSFDSEVAEFIRQLRNYRKLFKQYSVYVDGLLKRDYRGRLHGNFLLHGTSTGRLACKEPNLLNLPRKKGEGSIKRALLPDPGCIWVQGDLKTAELRVVGIEANCPYLIEVLSDPERDIHGEVATQRYGPSWTADQRVRAKAVVFGLGYGREAESIAIEYDMPIKEAEGVIKSFFELIPEVKAWQEDIRHRVWRGEDLRTRFGRMRRFHLITRENKPNVGREALAFIPQATANDINLTAAYRLWKLDHLDIRLLVHDSILVNCRPDEAEEIAARVSLVMQQAGLEYSDRIPFFAETTIGPNYGVLG